MRSLPVASTSTGASAPAPRSEPPPAAEAPVLELHVSRALHPSPPPPAASPVARVAPLSEIPRPPRATPPLPHAELPSQSLWPAGPGRALLRTLDPSSARLREDLVARHGKDEGSGASDVYVVEAGDLCLKTSERRRFASFDDARASLVVLARKKNRLGALLPPRTTLALAEDGGVAWLWTVTPWATTLRAQLAAAEQRGDDGALADALRRYARLAGQALSLACVQGLVLDVHPSNFGTIEGVDAYLDDDIGIGSRLPMIGWALLSRVDEYASAERAIDAYVDELERVVRDLLGHDQVESLDLAGSLESVLVRSTRAADARRRLVAACRTRRATA